MKFVRIYLMAFCWGFCVIQICCKNKLFIIVTQKGKLNIQGMLCYNNVKSTEDPGLVGKEEIGSLL